MSIRFEYDNGPTYFRTYIYYDENRPYELISICMNKGSKEPYINCLPLSNAKIHLEAFQKAVKEAEEMMERKFEDNKR